MSANLFLLTLFHVFFLVLKNAWTCFKNLLDLKTIATIAIFVRLEVFFIGKHFNPTYDNIRSNRVLFLIVFFYLFHIFCELYQYIDYVNVRYILK